MLRTDCDHTVNEKDVRKRIENNFELTTLEMCVVYTLYSTRVRQLLIFFLLSDLDLV